MKKKHFDNQCDFRKKVIQTSFKLLCDLKTLARSDQAFEARLNKLLHEEELRKLNRRRIIKIMSHESENYWFNEENADERLDSEVIFPEYIASTEYYHRLHAEALAYENFDYDLLDKVTSNEEAVKEKNKMLIPLFAALRQKIIAFKDDTDDLKQIQILTEVERIKSLNLP